MSGSGAATPARGHGGGVPALAADVPLTRLNWQMARRFGEQHALKMLGPQ